MKIADITQKLEQKKKIIISILITLILIGLIFIGISIYQNAYQSLVQQEDIKLKYTITDETTTVKIEPQVNIKDLEYNINFNVPFYQILFNTKGYSLERTQNFAEEGKTITLKFKTEEIKNQLKGYEVGSVDIHVKSGKVQNKYYIRPYDRNYQEKNPEGLLITGILIIAISTLGLITPIIYTKAKKYKTNIISFWKKIDFKKIYKNKKVILSAVIVLIAIATILILASLPKETLIVMVIAIIIILTVIMIIISNIKQREKEAKLQQEREERAAQLRQKQKEEETRIKREQEEARKIKEEEERKHQEWLNSTKCLICGEHSWGHYHCKDCWNRIPVIKKELPYSKIKDFETINKFKQELTDNVIFAESKYDQEFNAIRLMAVCEILKEKYFVSDAVEIARDFLEEILEYDYTQKDIIINKYASREKKLEHECDQESDHSSQKNSEPAEPQSQFAKTDFRQRYEKPYRCNDGDYVRSKSEREIDDFLFAHKIWHIYEPEYICHNGKKYYPDFLLSDYNLYIEYFGKTDEEYIAKKEQKIADLSAEPNIFFEYLEHTDDANITEKLTEICKKYNILK